MDRAHTIASARTVGRDRVAELRESWRSVLQVGLAASIAYFIAQELIGHSSPFFAPIAAVLTLGVSVGQRGRRAVEMGIGVALGIGVADLIVLLIGTGAWQVGLIVALAVAAGILAGGGAMLVNQAAASAVLVATLPVPSYSGARFIDAMIGAGVALLFNAIIPSHPVRMAKRELEPLLAELASIFDQLAGALTDRDRTAAAEALARGRNGEPAIATVRSTLSAGVETTVMAPPRRGSRGVIDDLLSAIDPIDFAWRNSRVLARNTLRSIDFGDPAPPDAIESVQLLAEAVRALDRSLWDESAVPSARHAAVCASVLATGSLADTANLSISAIVSQVRSIAVDLLKATGLTDAEALVEVRRAIAASATA